jgi:putative endonuclease
MHYVYVLRSKKDPNRYYVGETTTLEKRLKQHNQGKSTYSKRYAPWYIESFVCFRSTKLAKDFELYLKTGSGKTFLRRRLMADVSEKGTEA